LNHAAFIREHTHLAPSRLRPDIRLQLASELTPLWQATETFLQIQNIAPPFWAFAWPGGEALAAYIGSNPALVAGLRVLDFAAGSGLAAIAAAKSGGVVQAAEIDPLACAAIRLNAAANRAAIAVLEGDITGTACRWDVILCGDVCYEAAMTGHILPWLRGCAAHATVIIAEPGRSYAPRAGIAEFARYTVPVSRELEDSDAREVTLMRLLPSSDDD
jgi:predicted nicotinamide N-methyase